MVPDHRLCWQGVAYGTHAAVAANQADALDSLPEDRSVRPFVENGPGTLRPKSLMKQQLP